MSTTKLTITVTAALVLIAASSWALIPHPQGAPMTVTVQGKLTGSGGSPITPGDYTFAFSIHDAAVGGTNVWPALVTTEDHVITLGSDGLWTAYLGQEFPIHRDLVDDTARWLEVAVTPPVGPIETFDRIKFASAPFALEAAQLNGRTGLEFLAQDGDTVGGDLRFDENGDGTFDAKIDLSGLGSADLTLYQSGVETSKLWGTGWGELIMRDITGQRTIDLTGSQDFGGQLYMYKEDGSAGMTLKGGSTTDGATLYMRNAVGTTTITLDADILDNDGVVLPNNAISALEERDEPGVASSNATAVVNLDGTIKTLLSRSLTVPKAGYVLVMGTFTVDVEHANGTSDGAGFGVSDQAGSFPFSQHFYVFLDGSLPTGYYQQVVSVHGLFEVNSGLSTFYLLGQESGGIVKVYERQLSVIYFPTAYGTVTPPLAAGEGNILDRGAVTVPGLSAQDIAAEQAEAEQFNAARIERELATLRAQVQALMEKSRAEESAQRSNEGDR